MKGSLTGFQEIYRRYAQDVYRFSYWLSGDVEMARDLTSETFIRLWNARGDIRVETVKAYLLTIARNLYLKGKRNARKTVDLDHQIMDGGHTADALSEKRQELQAVTRSIQRLPEKERSALILRAYQDLPYAEIARMLEVSLSSAKVLVYRARQKLIAMQKEQEKEQ